MQFDLVQLSMTKIKLNLFQMLLGYLIMIVILF